MNAAILAGAVSAQEILEKEKKCPQIVTFSKELDAALDGGVATGKILEICKSRFALCTPCVFFAF